MHDFNYDYNFIIKTKLRIRFPQIQDFMLLSKLQAHSLFAKGYSDKSIY